MITIPKLLILDRDGLINMHSSAPTSPFYHIKNMRHFVLKPNVVTAFSILNVLDIPVKIATRQSWANTPDRIAVVTDIHDKMKSLIGYEHRYLPIYIEVEEETKLRIYQRLNYLASNLSPSEITVLDDSETQCAAARSLGLNAVKTTDLYSTVCELFNLNK